MVDLVLSSRTSPSSAVAREDERERVRLALELLDPVDREILSMRFFDNLGFKEVATILAITPNAANQRCVRALQKMKKLLETQTG